MRRYFREWKRRNPEKVRKYAKKNPRNCKLRRARFKAIVDLIKSKPCRDCKQSFPPRVMEFDHLDPKTKTCNISRMVGKLVTKASMVRILEEIEKCEVVCSNCHRLREIKRSEGLTVPQFVEDYSI